MKEYVKFSIIPIFVILLIGVASAQVTTNNQNYAVISEVPFSLSAWINSIFGTFSIVGNAQVCGSKGNPDHTWTLTQDQDLSLADTSSYCASNHGIYDIYSNDYSHPALETSNAGIADFYPSGLSCNAAKCIVELYCCPHPEPSSNSQCQNWGFSSMQKASCVAWLEGYKCTANGVTENSIPYASSTFGYCTGTVSVSCYHLGGSPQTCTQTNYAGYSSCSDLTGYGSTVFNTLSACQAKICTDNGACVASNVCTGSTCTTNCNVVIQGTKNCNVPSPDNWVNSPSECTGTKPIGCSNKTCVATASDCGTCVTQCIAGQIDCSTAGQVRTCVAIPNSNCANWSSYSADTSGQCVTPNETTSAKTLTLSQYYSTSDDKLVSGGYGCTDNSQCELKLGYNVKCDLSSDVQDRVNNGFVIICTKKILPSGTFGFVLNSVSSIINGNNFCTNFAAATDLLAKTFAGTSPGVCIGRSTSTFGGIWEGILDMVASIGIPGAYVMASAILIIILLASLLLPIITGAFRK